MKISDDQKKKYSAFMQDLWGLIKEFRNPEQAGEYWSELGDRATEISNKYDNDPMIMRFIIAFVDSVGAEQENKNDSEQ